MMILPDWTELNTSEYVEKQFGIKFEGEGWYPKRKRGEKLDTMLLTRVPSGNPTPMYAIRCWNDRDPREEMRKLLKLPTHGVL